VSRLNPVFPIDDLSQEFIKFISRIHRGCLCSFLFGLGNIEVSTLLGADFPEVNSFGETLLILLYAYVGFEGTTVTAGEGRSPRRDIPGALITTIVFIGVLYFLIQAVSVFTLPGLATSDAALADVANILFGSFGAAVLIFGAVFSIA